MLHHRFREARLTVSYRQKTQSKGLLGPFRQAALLPESIHPSITHPSIFYTHFLVHPGLPGSAGVYPSCHWAKAGWQPGQMVNSLQPQIKTNKHTLIYTRTYRQLRLHISPHLLAFGTLSHLSPLQVCIFLGITTKHMKECFSIQFLRKTSKLTMWATDSFIDDYNSWTAA